MLMETRLQEFEQQPTLHKVSSLPEYMRWPLSSANATVLTSDWKDKNWMTTSFYKPTDEIWNIERLSRW